MEGSTYNCRGDSCKCQVSTEGDYCSDKCKSSNDYGHCHCGHPDCAADSDSAGEAAHMATQGDEKVS
jgi:hypothetical protein